MDPAQCIKREARSLITDRYHGPIKARPTAMVEALTDLLHACYEELDAEIPRLRDQEGLTFSSIADALGVSRQAVWQRYELQRSKLPGVRGV